MVRVPPPIYNTPSKLTRFPSEKGSPDRSSIARVLLLPWGGLDGSPPHATFSPAHPLARRDVPLARARAFSVLHLPKGVARLSFTARIGRALSHRTRSASKKDGLATPFPSFQARSLPFQGGGLDWPPTAHVERPQFHRGRSVSKGDQPRPPYLNPSPLVPPPNPPQLPPNPPCPVPQYSPF